MKIAYLSLTFGIGLCIIALVLYPWPVSTSEPSYYRDPQGFLFFTSEDIDPNQEGRVHAIVENLTWQKDEAGVRLWIDTPLLLKKHNGSVFFVLQVLHEISDARVEISSWPIEHFGGNLTVVPYPNANNCDNSYLLIEMPRENLTGWSDFYITFLWKNVLWRRTYSEYYLIVPFNAVFPSFIYDVTLPEESLNGNGILIFDYTFETKLSITRPKAVTVSEIVPAADHYGLSYDRLWYTWDIKEKCNWTEYSSTAIVMDIEVDELRTDHEKRFSISFLFFGIGIPMILTSIFKIWEEEPNSKTRGQTLDRVTPERKKGPNLKTLETIYKEVFKRFQFERDRTKHLDDKASNIIGFVGIITGLVSGLGGFLLKPPINATKTIATILFFVTLVCLILSFIFGLRAYHIKEFTVVPDPYFLIGRYEEEKRERIIQDLYDNYAVSIEQNMMLNDQKVGHIKKAMNSLFFAISLLPFFVLAVIYG